MYLNKYLRRSLDIYLNTPLFHSEYTPWCDTPVGGPRRTSSIQSSIKRESMSSLYSPSGIFSAFSNSMFWICALHLVTPWTRSFWILTDVSLERTSIDSCRRREWYSAAKILCIFVGYGQLPRECPICLHMPHRGARRSRGGEGGASSVVVIALP